MASITVVVGNNSFKIPIEGANPPWGEDLTEYFVAVADALTNVQGPNDILISTAALANNQSSPANIPGLVFNSGAIQGVEVTFLAYRIYDSGASTVVEQGKILGNYDGTTFSIATESAGNAGLAITVDNSGQFLYTSTNLANHVSTTLKYKAQTIDS